jgi:transcriptional regulator with XRE-family HTH domain
VQEVLRIPLFSQKMHDLIWIECYRRTLMDDEAKKRLKEILEEVKAGRSQRQLAHDLGVSLGTVQNWLAGDSFPSSEKLEKIATAVGMTIEQLFVRLMGEDALKPTEPKVAEDVLVQAKMLDKAQKVRLLKLLIDELASGDSA